MEENDYLCRSWFKLLIRGLVPLHNCGSRLCERAAFLRLSVKICRSNVKNARKLHFLKKKLRKNLEI